MQQSSNRPVLLFYLLAAYVLLQFSWWTYYLIDLNSELRNLSLAFSTDEIHKAELESAYRKKVYMILGEAAVFTAFLSLGLIQVRRYMRKETALARLQNNFLLSVTHEIKSPLASFRLIMETIIKRDLPVAKQKELAQKALAEAERLILLSDKMLTAAKIESSTDVFHPENLNLSKLLSDCAIRLAENTGNQHRIRTEIQPDIEIKADAIAIETLACNLLENALKYSPTDSNVILKLHKTEQNIFLSVSDLGPGISVSERQKIFNKFYRSGNEETRKSKGTGLGLYIVKQIAMQHHAEIKVDSNGEKGSIFTVRFNTKS